MIVRTFLALVLVMSTPAIVLACGNAIRVSDDDAVQQILNAENLLAKGEYVEAHARVDPRFYIFERKGLTHRANRVHAAAVFRTRNERKTVKQAVALLENQLDSDKDNAVLRALVAEGYVALKQNKKARAILQDLQTRDLMPDAYAYRTLAWTLGQNKAGKDAMAQCALLAQAKNHCVFGLKKRGMALSNGSPFKGPKVEISDIKTIGQLDANIVRRYLRRKLIVWRHCYHESLIAGNFEGEVRIDFRVSMEGHIYDVTGETTSDGKLDSCIVNTVGNILLPKPRTGGVKASMSLVFSAGS